MLNDESRFTLKTDSRRIMIWRKRGTRFHSRNFTERHNFTPKGVNGATVQQYDSAGMHNARWPDRFPLVIAKRYAIEKKSRAMAGVWTLRTTGMGLYMDDGHHMLSRERDEVPNATGARAHTIRRPWSPPHMSSMIFNRELRERQLRSRRSLHHSPPTQIT
ncbi:hypothetical protein TNCV_4554811 [Trichonephila clavipes]|nr:hypothetical protein TNCV_4554811 [Trichonephila clavipes]